MPSIIKTPTGYRAQIMLKGIRKSKSFPSKKMAIVWAQAEENQIRESHQASMYDEIRPGISALIGVDKFANPSEVKIDGVSLSRAALEGLLQRAAEIGAERAIVSLVTYQYMDAAKQLGICTKTLMKRIHEGKIKSVDGRITGAELLRYLGGFPSER